MAIELMLVRSGTLDSRLSHFVWCVSLGREPAVLASPARTRCGTIDVERRRLDVALSDTQISDRLNEWRAPKALYSSGVLAKYGPNGCQSVVAGLDVNLPIKSRRLSPYQPDPSRTRAGCLTPNLLKSRHFAEVLKAVQRRRFPVGASPTRQTAPAGSNRSSHGGNEVAEAFD
jgi:hypothetical protein